MPPTPSGRMMWYRVPNAWPGARGPVVARILAAPVPRAPLVGFGATTVSSSGGSGWGSADETVCGGDVRAASAWLGENDGGGVSTPVANCAWRCAGDLSILAQW